jgi:diguanylate cyclase (GGDEF)-like protein
MFAPMLLDRSLAGRLVLRTPGFTLVLATGVAGLLATLLKPAGGASAALAWSSWGRMLGALVSAGALGAAVRSYGVLRRTVRDRTHETTAARAEALTDELTGLYNRRGFRTLAEHQLKVARRTGRDLLLLCVDLDRFKPINDRFGHAEGDRALAEVAAIMRATMRETDVVARLGGDEFAVLVVDADDATEDAVLARLYRAFAQRNAAPGRRYDLSATIGVSRLDRDRAADLAELLEAADASLYGAKRAGRLQAA